MTLLVSADGIEIPGRLSKTLLCLKESEVTCLIGPNGSGKTSLLHAIAGIGASGGKVVIAGQRLASAPPKQRKGLLAFMPASRDIGWPVAAQDLIMIGGAEPVEAERMIAKLELERLSARRADCLSTGERARLLLARALACSPRLMLLDEPLANLDPLWKIRMVDLIRQEAKQPGRCALIAVHDLDVAAALADRIIVMHGGAIVADGSTAQIMCGSIIPEIFGVQRCDGAWTAVRPSEDPRSLP